MVEPFTRSWRAASRNGGHARRRLARASALVQSADPTDLAAPPRHQQDERLVKSPPPPVAAIRAPERSARDRTLSDSWPLVQVGARIVRAWTRPSPPASSGSATLSACGRAAAAPWPRRPRMVSDRSVCAADASAPSRGCRGGQGRVRCRRLRRHRRQRRRRHLKARWGASTCSSADSDQVETDACSRGTRIAARSPLPSFRMASRAPAVDQ